MVMFGMTGCTSMCWIMHVFVYACRFVLYCLVSDCWIYVHLRLVVFVIVPLKYSMPVMTVHPSRCSILIIFLDLFLFLFFNHAQNTYICSSRSLIIQTDSAVLVNITSPCPSPHPPPPRQTNKPENNKKHEKHNNDNKKKHSLAKHAERKLCPLAANVVCLIPPSPASSYRQKAASEINKMVWRASGGLLGLSVQMTDDLILCVRHSRII